MQKQEIPLILMGIQFVNSDPSFVKKRAVNGQEVNLIGLLIQF